MGTVVKALSVVQPHATTCAAGVQTIITRATTTGHRGRIAIVAEEEPEMSDEVLLAANQHLLRPDIVIDPRFKAAVKEARDFYEAHGVGYDLDRVVGSAVLTDVLPIHAYPYNGPGDHTGWPTSPVVVTGGGFNGEPDANTLVIAEPHKFPSRHITDQLPFSDFTPGRWAYLLEDAQPCEPVPCKGQSGLWTLPPEIERQAFGSGTVVAPAGTGR